MFYWKKKIPAILNDACYDAEQHINEYSARERNNSIHKCENYYTNSHFYTI